MTTTEQEPSNDPRKECDALAAKMATLLRYVDEKNYDMAEFTAEDLLSQALRVRRATIMMSEEARRASAQNKA